MFNLSSLMVLDELSITHKDIKPQNFVIVGKYENWFDQFNKESIQVYLTDFGAFSITNIGTPIYAAPEFLSPEITNKRN